MSFTLNFNYLKLSKSKRMNKCINGALIDPNESENSLSVVK